MAELNGVWINSDSHKRYFRILFKLIIKSKLRLISSQIDNSNTFHDMTVFTKKEIED